MAHIESPTERKSRYSAAVAQKDLIIDKLEKAYRFLFPTENVFFDKSPSNDRERDVFDTVPVEALKGFANGIC